MGAIKAGIFRETLRKFLRRQGETGVGGVSVGERDLLSSDANLPAMRLSEGVHSLPVEDAAGPDCVEDAIELGPEKFVKAISVDDKEYMPGVYEPMAFDDWAHIYFETGGEG